MEIRDSLVRSFAIVALSILAAAGWLAWRSTRAYPPGGARTLLGAPRG